MIERKGRGLIKYAEGEAGAEAQNLKNKQGRAESKSTTTGSGKMNKQS